MRTLRGHQGPVTCVRLLPVVVKPRAEGAAAAETAPTPPHVYAVTGSWDKTVRKWDLNVRAFYGLHLNHRIRTLICAY